MTAIDTSPPLAWELFGADGPHGDVTWKGGADVDLHTGPGLRQLLDRSIAPLLGAPDVGAELTRFFAELRTISGGAVSAKPVAREVVVATIRWDAAATADGGALPPTDPAARYKNNVFPQGFDVRELLAGTRDGAIVWEPTHAHLPGLPAAYKASGTMDGEEYWLTISTEPDRKTYTLAITQGPSVKPRMVEQSNGIFGRSDLAKLYDHLVSSSDI